MRYLIATVLTFGCAAYSPGKPAIALTARGSPTDGAMIVRIVGRRDAIVVRAAADGARYSLETKGGQVIVPAATLGSLAMKKPELSHTVHAMQASADLAGVDDGPAVP